MSLSATLRNKLKHPEIVRTDCLINGEWISGKERFEVINPANGEPIATVPRLGYAESMTAIKQAHEAWNSWRKNLVSERARILLRWAALIREHGDDLAILMTQEMGKPLAQSRSEIDYATGFIDWYAFEAQSHFGETIPPTQAGRRETVWKEPVGVVAAITPWNFPAAMATRKLGPALAAGCPVILKPAEASPLTALALGHLAVEAGIPAGILNIITGQASEIGRAFTESGLVRKLSFTGSTAVGKKLYADCAPTVKKLSLELGGNAPFIVFDDADLDAALKGLEISKFRNTGQTCVCANRIFLQEGIHDRFRDMLVERVRQMKTGDPMDKSHDIGCLMSKQAFDGVKHLIDATVSSGAKLLIGGGTPEGLRSPFLAPTVLENVSNDMPVCRNEIFGPVAVLIKFRTEEEVLHLANDTDYGLAAYFYTRDYQRIFRMGEGLEYGMIGVNSGHVSSVAAPFGGYKQSGLGREASRYGLEEFLETKYLALGGLDR